MCDGRRNNFQRLPTLLIVMVGLSFAFLACGCVSVRYALAEDGSGGGSFDYGVVYGPNSAAGLSDSDDPRYLVQVYAPNKFDAALIALGYNPTSSSFTDDARAYLSNQSTGGAFYDFAQLFSNNNTDWGEEITTNPSLTPGINFDVTNMETALRINNSTYGASNVWSAEYTTSQRIAAVTAVGLVLSGSIGGGSGSGGTGNVAPVPAGYTRYICKVPVSGSANMQIYDTEGNTWSNKYDAQYLLPQNLYVDIPDSLFTRLNADYPEFSYRYIKVRNGGPSFSFEIIASDGQFTYDEATVELNGVTRDYYNKVYYTSGRRRFFGWKTFYTNNSAKYYTFDGTRIMLYDTSDDFGTGGSQNMSNESYGTTMAIGFVTDDTTPIVPPTNWPDPPDNPTVEPPSVPDPPTDDPIQQPTDTPIQPPNVWTPIVSPTDPTFTVDLQGVLDAMATHCKHIRDNLDANFAQLYNNMTDYWSRKYTNFKQFLDGQFGYVGETIVDKTDDLMEYLEDLFEWLAEQFEFSVSGTGYNDNTVVSWLRKIYARLGGGTTIRPPDPVVQPKETGDWLNQLLQNLVLDLLAIGQDVLADLVESFRELITKFPFSIPWDIAAILALLVAEPQAPVIEVPQYTYTGLALQQVGTYRIDLSQWNSVMDVVRPMETILFAGWLAFKTDFFKGLLEMTKG